MDDLKMIKFAFSDQVNFRRSFGLREVVFIDEQNVDPAIEYEYEEESHFYLIERDGKAIATARWRETPKGIKLERFVVLKEERGNNIGKMILDEILRDVLPLNKKIYLNAQTQAIPFYQKAGFETAGDAFLEAEIEHYLMIFKE